MEKVQLRRAIATDLPRIQQLLKDSGLPWEDVSEHLAHFVVAESGKELVGTAGMEIHENAALLRSLAVLPPLRNKGLGSLLYKRIMQQAKNKGVRQVSLLTTTAEKYFAKKGFQKVAAEQVPGYVKETKEYQILCPSSAICMTKKM